ncbi:MAG TPA: LCP family protein [Candidatus Saccharibacteria bacterium]|nr:LCP family protein [Candidatus Saccharibacteria bacterium]
MPKNRNSVDGFIPRRATSDISNAPTEGTLQSSGKTQRPQIGEARPIEPGTIRRPVGAVSRSEIDESLDGIDDEPQKKRRRFFRRRVKKVPTRKQRIIKRVILGVVLLLLAIVAYVGIRAFLASQQLFQGNIFDVFQNQPLKMDENGRSNIVIFGTSEDDPGHEGALLSDSIMLVSVDQNKKNAYLLSIPRDLWVKYGQACNSGYEGRINEVYSCFSADGKNEKAGANALKDKVGEVTGLDVQYYVHMNYGVLRDAVNAVGGVSVVIDSDDPRGIFDDNFDWKCKYQCNYVKYKNGPTGLMDGEHALALARARGASGNTYGLAGANFDREKYQQKILVALKERAASAGTLTNVGKVTALIDAMGKNLRTNFQTSEIQTLMKLGREVDAKEITSLSLNSEENVLVTGTNIGGASVLVPSAGIYEFGQIQAYVKKQLSSSAVVREAANVVVLNATAQAGVAQEEADLLEDKGYIITATGNAPAGSYGDYAVYAVSKDKPGTKKALAKRYGVTVKTSKLPVVVAAGTDFVVIIGKVPSSSGN